MREVLRGHMILSTPSRSLRALSFAAPSGLSATADAPGPCGWLPRAGLWQAGLRLGRCDSQPLRVMQRAEKKIS
jgi:hypothetical protein